jgi:hypothetical protein
MTAKKKKSAKKPAAKRRIPRQDVLPGVGDAKIAAIENAALDYAELRDERVALSAREVELKQKLMDLMHAKDITEYRRNGISVFLTVEKEGIKVRVKQEEELDAEGESGEESEAQPD